MQDSLTSSYTKCVLLLTAGMSLVLLIVFILYSTIVHADSTNTAEQKIECFTSIRVYPGESLWEISRRYYSKEYQSMNQYIRKIMKLNHMTDEKIYAGAYLIIPYYKVQEG